MAAPPNARRERLAKELEEAELSLDALTRKLEPGQMRTQAAIEGMRAKVYGLRAELLAIRAAAGARSSSGDTSVCISTDRLTMTPREMKPTAGTEYRQRAPASGLS